MRKNISKTIFILVLVNYGLNIIFYFLKLKLSSRY